MTRKEPVASVQIVFSVEPGGPAITIADVIAWTEATINREPVEGFNSLRYSTAKVTSAVVSDQR